MAVELLLPGRRISAPKPPTYLALDMAFGVGAGAVLGDKSRYRSHGAITGAVPAAGVHGYCLDFDPTIPSYVLVPAAHTQLNFTSEDYSIISRVNIDDLTVSSALLHRGSRNVEGYYFRIAIVGWFGLETSQLAARQDTQTNAGEIVINTWYTLGVSRAGAVVTLYKNGVDVTAAPGVHIDSAPSARSAQIGICAGLVAAPMRGKMEFLRIFRNIALQASEHLAWHRALA